MVAVVTMILAAWAAVASTAALMIVAGARLEARETQEAQERPDADPAKVLREWLYGGDR